MEADQPSQVTFHYAKWIDVQDGGRRRNFVVHGELRSRFRTNKQIDSESDLFVSLATG